ncbi:GCN5-related N-acetyltransferase [Xylanimonas cellulosilytica DSM 15894]|uniref:GCN5-related N-acetyltransferase n=1 Tax=Xylanimonas cellulosilytica (strain DSM 15894 / JCM 12276 / CECT 5975 / KCTC 9989 / LMG 20990 / NBRC 107835 / XIL07) TaxID=446471 RepID=D1BS45_XYLCX|nr:GNAT family N-acetyltransferase [Xylanimonas cellulosilytica]ACZ30537.1 GCN5-related N-acetyltransferase [Xylanimonas cellulosilytica DSM 15894]
MRSTPEVRAADRDDLVVVAALTAVARPAATVGVPVDTAGEDAIRTHLSVYLASGGHVLVAELDGHIVGFTLARTAGPYLFADIAAWVVDTLYVTPDARRRGVGHSLVAGVAALAGESGAPYVYAGATSSDRGMQRFLARLGFAPAAGHRVVATPTLLRRLAQEGGPSASRSRGRRDGTRAAIDDIIARRRRTREAGTHSAPVDMRHRRVS